MDYGTKLSVSARATLAEILRPIKMPLDLARLAKSLTIRLITCSSSLVTASLPLSWTERHA